MRKLIIIVMALALASCTKASFESTYNSQEAKIDQFIESQLKRDSTLTVVHNKGSHRLVLSPGQGEELGEKGRVAFYYCGYVFNSGISPQYMFATNNKDEAESVGWNAEATDFEVKTVDMSSADLHRGLREGLVGVKAGEQCIILFSGKYGFGKKSVGTIPANSALAYVVWVEGVSNE
ncbi:MAG: FKBP-type peptidyl-prolyl cis-trans isomerase [Bacteroidales bacterium]|nr:FKBP-type peptidyl-prolyl cis-trans isomerase [Bacteroidales bacterium]